MEGTLVCGIQGGGRGGVRESEKPNSMGGCKILQINNVPPLLLISGGISRMGTNLSIKEKTTYNRPITIIFKSHHPEIKKS